MRVEYEGRISEEIWMQSQRLHMGRRRWLISFLFPVIMTLFAWVDTPAISASLLWIVFAICCSFPPLLWYFMTRNIRKVFRTAPYLKEPVRAALTDEGIAWENSNGSGVIPWKNFIFRKETGDLVLLYQATNLFNVIPREFFSSEDSWRDARAVIEQRVPKKK